MDEWKRNNKNIIQLKNKTPIWNDGMNNAWAVNY